VAHRQGLDSLAKYLPVLAKNPCGGLKRSPEHSGDAAFLDPPPFRPWNASRDATKVVRFAVLDGFHPAGVVARRVGYSPATDKLTATIAGIRMVPRTSVQDAREQHDADLKSCRVCRAG
jgi:hypothetical protein